MTEFSKWAKSPAVWAFVFCVVYLWALVTFIEPPEQRNAAPSTGEIDGPCNPNGTCNGPLLVCELPSYNVRHVCRAKDWHE